MSRKIDKMVKEAKENGNTMHKVLNRELEFEWCCDCHLRHVNIYKIVRGKTPKEDMVFIEGIRDDMGTELRRDYIRRKKNKG